MTSFRSGWRSQTLKSKFERTVVGFDLRKGDSLNSLFMTSYDELVRYEELNEQHQNELTGLNLFNIDPSKIPSLTIPIDGRVVAFDLPTKFVIYLSNGSVSNPQPLPAAWSSKSWEFMGFDVVDAITQTSALHGFDWSLSNLKKITEKLKLQFNSHGLIEDEDAALGAARFFDDFVEKHAPFAPCGIWLKKY